MKNYEKKCTYKTWYTKSDFGFGKWLHVENVLAPYNVHTKIVPLIKHVKCVTPKADIT